VAATYLVPGRAAIVAVDDVPIGVLGLLQPAIADRRGAPKHDAIYVAELNLDRLETLRPRVGEDRAVRALPRYPAVTRDLSLVVGESLPAEIIRGTILAASRAAVAPLAAVTFFDRYKGKGLAADTVSVSVRLTFQSPDRTLTDADVQQSIDTILAALVREHRAVQR
jgi:phenylalanyl-tRNA synthetase beta chain